jgi:hypothetical protein
MGAFSCGYPLERIVGFPDKCRPFNYCLVMGSALLATWLRWVADSEVAPAAIFIQSTRFVTVSFGLWIGAEDSGNVPVVKFLRSELLTIR